MVQDLPDPAAHAGQRLLDRLAFRGVTITDALEAGALEAFGDTGQRAVRAAAAGMDIVLCSARDVAQGQEVKTGEVVAVLEAMKMQNIIRAERDGVVKTVNAKAGDPVAADEVLVEFA